MSFRNRRLAVRNDIFAAAHWLDSLSDRRFWGAGGHFLPRRCGWRGRLPARLEALPACDDLRHADLHSVNKRELPLLRRNAAHVLRGLIEGYVQVTDVKGTSLQRD